MIVIGQTHSGYIPWGYSNPSLSAESTSNRIRIQNTLIELGHGGIFFAVSYDPATGLAQPTDPDQYDAVSPNTVLCNERNSGFAPDNLMGRRHSLFRSSWVFNLILEFAQEVSVEFFERDLLDEIISLDRDIEKNLPQTFLKLLNTTIEHPVRQQGAKGTRVVFAFQAQIGRI